MKAKPSRILSTVFVALMVGAMFAKARTATADDLIPAVSSLNSAGDVVLIDARADEKCLQATHPGALCLPLDKVLNAEGRLANMRDVRWLFGSYGLTGSEHVAIYADDAKIRDSLAAIFYLAGQDRVSRLVEGAKVDLNGRGITGALSRENLFAVKVRVWHLQSAPFGRVSAANLADFVGDLNQDPHALFAWPVGYL